MSGGPARLAGATCETPAGTLRLALLGGRLCGLAFTDRWGVVDRFLRRRFGDYTLADGPAEAREALDALGAYFGGELVALDRLPVDTGGTEFQRSVWTALRAIRPGATTSYGELARTVGRPDAARAVGAANGANPVWIVVPCHRAIGRSGRLVGYAGGLGRKQWLLAHESARGFC